MDSLANKLMCIEPSHSNEDNCSPGMQLNLSQECISSSASTESESLIVDTCSESSGFFGFEWHPNYLCALISPRFEQLHSDRKLVGHNFHQIDEYSSDDDSSDSESSISQRRQSHPQPVHASESPREKVNPRGIKNKTKLKEDTSEECDRSVSVQSIQSVSRKIHYLESQSNASRKTVFGVAGKNRVLLSQHRYTSPRHDRKNVIMFPDELSITSENVLNQQMSPMPNNIRSRCNTGDWPVSNHDHTTPRSKDTINSEKKIDVHKNGSSKRKSSPSKHHTESRNDDYVGDIFYFQNNGAHKENESSATGRKMCTESSQSRDNVASPFSLSRSVHTHTPINCDDVRRKTVLGVVGGREVPVTKFVGANRHRYW